MGEVPAHSGALVVRVPGSLARVRILVAKRDIVVDKVTYGLHSSPSEGTLIEQAPRDFRQTVRLAVGILLTS